MKDISYQNIVNPPKVSCNSCRYGIYKGECEDWEWCESLNAKEDKSKRIQRRAGNFKPPGRIYNLKEELNSDGHCRYYEERRDLSYKFKKMFGVNFNGQKIMAAFIFLVACMLVCVVLFDLGHHIYDWSLAGGIVVPWYLYISFTLWQL